MIAYGSYGIYCTDVRFLILARSPGDGMKKYPVFRVFQATAFLFRMSLSFLLFVAVLSSLLTLTAARSEAAEKSFQDPARELPAGFDRPGTFLLLAAPEERCVDSFLLRTGASMKKDLETRDFVLARPTLDGKGGLKITLLWPAQKAAFENFWAEHWPYFMLESSGLTPEGGLSYSAVMRADFLGMVWEIYIMQSMAVLQQRIALAGVSEWRVQRLDGGRIAVWLNSDDPRVLARILPRPELLGFHLVRDDLKPESGPLPANVVFLPVKAPDDIETGGRQSAPVEEPAGLGGESLIASDAVLDHFGGPYVSLAFDRQGAKELTKFTGDNIGRRLAIVFDGVIYVMPMIAERISVGEVSVVGNFSPAEAGELAARLSSVFLPVPLTLLRQQAVEP